MITVDIKSLLNRMNAYCTHALEGAAGACVSRTHYEVTVEHYLSRLLEEPQSDIPLLLRQIGVDAHALKWSVDEGIEALRTGNSGKPVFSPLLVEWLEEAWLVSSIDFQEQQIRSGALLSALVDRLYRLAEGRYIDILKPVKRDVLYAQLATVANASIEKASREEKPQRGEPAAPAAP